MVEFGDYQRTSCGAFARDTEPALIRRYVDTGVVRLVWRDFPWVDAQSVSAAVGARAAGLQGKFWAYHDYLSAHQFPDEHSGLVTGGYLRSVTRRLVLNMTMFNRDVTGPALAAAVRADDAFGQQLGVPGTPAFLIGGRPFFGAQPLPAFEAAIAQSRRGPLSCVNESEPLPSVLSYLRGSAIELEPPRSVAGLATTSASSSG